MLQLGGPEALGRNRRGGSAVLKDITASACDDTVRLNFVRNDLLLWTSQVAELRELGKTCTAGRALLQPFVASIPTYPQSNERESNHTSMLYKQAQK